MEKMDITDRYEGGGGKEEDDDDAEVDDYLTMTIPEPSTTTTTNSKTRARESLTQASKRKQREAEIRSRVKSKAEVAAEEAARRNEALQRSALDPSSKGYRMMAKLGYKPGDVLGGQDEGSDGREDRGTKRKRLLEPLAVEIKEGRGGIGADAEKKRRVRDEMQAKAQAEIRVKVDADGFRDRQRLEREERRREGQILGAQRVAERLQEQDSQVLGGGGDDDGVREDGDDDDRKDEGCQDKKSKIRGTPLNQVNVLWRGAIKHRELAERDRRMRHDLQQSLSRLPAYGDGDENDDDKLAFGRKGTEEADVDLDQEDPELDEFEALDTTLKLQRLVQYLRSRWHYCYWCKYRYVDDNMEGCPGTTEDDHD